MLRLRWLRVPRVWCAQAAARGARAAAPPRGAPPHVPRLHYPLAAPRACAGRGGGRGGEAYGVLRHCAHTTRGCPTRGNKRMYRPAPKHSALPRYYARYGAAPCHCIKTEKRARRIALASIKTERELSSATLPRTVWCGLPRTGRSQEASPVGWAHGRQPEASCGRVGSYSVERAANSGHRGSAQMACRYPGRSTPIVQLGYE